MKSKFLKRTLPSCFLLLAIPSCGWHLSENYIATNKPTLSIPYVTGDNDGLLTAALVEQIEKQGKFRYVSDQGGDFTLKVEILQSKSMHIGFRKDPKKLPDKHHKLIPNETRRKLLSKVLIINTLSQETLLGPAYIIGSCDFDHQYYSLNNDINKFSLGQLTDIDTAYDVVDIPLHRDLARNISYYLENHSDDLKT